MIHGKELMMSVLLALMATAQAQDARPGPGRYFVAVDGRDEIGRAHV